jgi:hypothetical protein
MTVDEIATAVNERRLCRGKEPVRLARIARIVRWLRCNKQTGRHPAFSAMNRAPKPSRRWDVPATTTLTVIYRRHGR